MIWTEPCMQCNNTHIQLVWEVAEVMVLKHVPEILVFLKWLQMLPLYCKQWFAVSRVVSKTIFTSVSMVVFILGNTCKGPFKDVVSHGEVLRYYNGCFPWIAIFRTKPLVRVKGDILYFLSLLLGPENS